MAALHDLDKDCQERFNRLDKPRVQLAPENRFFRGLANAILPSILVWTLILLAFYFGWHR